MDTKVQVQNPESVSVSITITQQLGQWKRMLSALDAIPHQADCMPAMDLRAVIRRAINGISDVITPGGE